MVTPVGLSVFSPLPIHRVANPKPVELAQRPAPVAEAASGQGAASPAPTGPLVAGATSALMGIDPTWLGGGDASAFAQAKAAGAYGLASMAAPAEALTPTAPKWAYEEVSGLGYFPAGTSSTQAKMQAHLRGEIAAARDAARREQQLSDTAGVEVRLAYDPNTEKAVALYPGDPGYDEVKGARAAFARMPSDLARMGERYADYAELLKL